jgi:hypothetical protein
VSGKAFSTLPFMNEQKNRLLTSFDLAYDFITSNVANHSDPGVYVLSTDMVLHVPHNGKHFILKSCFLKHNVYGLKKLIQENISIKNTQICVFSCLVEKGDLQKHGVYDTDSNVCTFSKYSARIL